MTVVARVQQIQALLFGMSWNYFFSNTFDPLLVESSDLETADMDRLYFLFAIIGLGVAWEFSELPRRS